MKQIYILLLLILAALSVKAQNKVGINTDTPTENLDVKGIARLRAFPLDGAANSIYTQTNGTASSTKDQRFLAGATMVADANGVLGKVIGGFPIASVTKTFVGTAQLAAGTATAPGQTIDFPDFSVGFYRGASPQNKFYMVIKSNTTSPAFIDLREFTDTSYLFPSGVVNLTAGNWFDIRQGQDLWYFVIGQDAWYADVKIENTKKVFQITVLGAKRNGNVNSNIGANDQITVNIQQMYNYQKILLP